MWESTRAVNINVCGKYLGLTFSFERKNFLKRFGIQLLHETTFLNIHLSVLSKVESCLLLLEPFICLPIEVFLVRLSFGVVIELLHVVFQNAVDFFLD